MCSANRTVAASTPYTSWASIQRRTVDAQSSAISARASERARTPSERFVSWVVPASIVVGVSSCTSSLVAVERLDRRGELAGGATDLAQRRQRQVAVERAVLGTLGHRRARQLLPPGGDRRHRADELDHPLDRLGEIGPSGDRPVVGGVELDHRGGVVGQVRAVAVHADGQLDQRRRVRRSTDRRRVRRRRVGPAGRGPAAVPRRAPHAERCPRRRRSCASSPVRSVHRLVSGASAAGSRNVCSLTRMCS